MDTRIKILAFILPLFSLLLSRSYTAATTTTLPPPSSALLAADVLRARGYSHFAALLLSLPTTTNFSGTLLAPPDFAFSFATAKFFNNHRAPPRPSLPLLLYHTLKSLAWPPRADHNELQTLYYNKCLFLSQNPYGPNHELVVSSSPFKNPISAVKIRQTNLYVDENLTVHGIDGVLDPNLAKECSIPYGYNPTVQVAPRHRNRLFLDHSMRALRKSGYHVVAAAMAVTKSELLNLESVTVFAVSDRSFFLKAGGFVYDFRHHVVPERHRLAAIEKLAARETEFETLAANKSVVVDSVDGAVRVNGVSVGDSEVYRNRWIVVVSVESSLDGTVDCSNYSAPLTEITGNGNLTGAPSPAAADFDSVGAPSPTVDHDVDSASTTSAPSPAPATEAAHYPGDSPTQETDGDDVGDTHCDLDAAVSLGVEGGDIFCPGTKARELLESDVHVEESKPSDAVGQVPADVARSDVHVDADGQASDDLALSEKVKISDNVNIADDLFFYI